MEDEWGAAATSRSVWAPLAFWRRSCSFSLRTPGRRAGGRADVARAGATYVGVATCGGTPATAAARRTARSSARTSSCSGRIRRPPPARTAAPGECCASRASRAIAERLGIGEATSAPMCLGCHATPGRPARRPLPDHRTASAAKAATAPPSGWLPAIMRSAAPMPTTSRAAWCRSTIRGPAPARCLDCHFGSAGDGQFVTHRIMAAGHPRISFELDLFSTLQQHYNDRRRLSSAARARSECRPRSGRSARRWRWTARCRCSPPRAAPRASSPNSISSTATPATARSRTIRASGPAAIANPGRPIPSGMPPYQ